MKNKYHWFTIIELLISIVVISIALLSILWLLRVAVSYTNKTRQETIAINLAREWIESVYNRRNTNRLKRSWEKDKYRLTAFFEVPSYNNLIRFQWNFTLHRPFWVIWNNTWSGIFKPYQNLTSMSQSILSLWNKSTYVLWTQDFINWESPDSAGKFYRAIIGIWLYQKDTLKPWGNLLPNCRIRDDTYDWIDINWASFQWICWDSHPKEFRFCSRVEYEKMEQKWDIELCWVITNHEE